METLRTIIRGDLAPVGNPIRLGPRKQCNLELPGFYSTWVDSGTSALALALLAARTLKPDINKPEVIIPAYCCPDLVAACAYAGCIAKLVDIRSEGWGFDLTQLSQAISSKTLAVIGVNFLGIREDWAGIKGVLALHGKNILTIEDNAQWFPNLEDQDPFFTDYVIFSFGKGKPISLLGGGVLFSRHELPEELAPRKINTSRMLLRGKLLLFNQILKPNIYWFVNHNPLFTPGQTNFKPLFQIQEMDNSRRELLGANYDAFIKIQNNTVQRYDDILIKLNHDNAIFPDDRNRIKQLLRYPLLCSNHTQRDRLLSLFKKNGLGATAMYQNPLVNIECPKEFVDAQNPQANALKFSNCLITLPCHESVSQPYFKQINRLLVEIFTSDRSAIS